MRRDLQKRLLAVAAILEAKEKVADGEDPGFFKKLFTREPKPMVAPEAPADKPTKAPEAKLPKPQQAPEVPVNAVTDYLKGGPIPLEILNPLTDVAKTLAGAGAVSAKDAKLVLVYMAKMLRKYLAGQKLAKKASASSARRARLAAKATKTAGMVKTAILSNQHRVSNDGGYHYVLADGASPKDPEAWDIEVGHVSGLYRGNVNVDGSQCVMFQGSDGKMYAVLRQNAQIEEPAPVEEKEAYTAQLKAFLAAKGK